MARSKERLITQWELERQAKILAALNVDIADLRDSMIVPAKIRVVRVVDETSSLGKWQNATLCLQVYEAPKQKQKLIVCISVQSFSWAEYTLGDFDEKDFTFMAEEYLMQIEHPGRVPDEVLEREQAQEIAAMEQYVSNFFGGITSQHPPENSRLEQSIDDFFNEFDS